MSNIHAESHGLPSQRLAGVSMTSAGVLIAASAFDKIVRNTFVRFRPVYTVFCFLVDESSLAVSMRVSFLYVSYIHPCRND